MKAAILAAGLGTRLLPLTQVLPKALVPVCHRPLLGLLLSQLAEAGCVQAAVNTHHLGEEILHFLGREGPWGLQVQVSHEPEILGTGGGLRNLARLLGPGPFLAVNADILTDLDFAALFARRDPGAVTTLVVQDHPPHNNVWLDGAGDVCGIGPRPPQAVGPPLAYTGIQVVEPGMLTWLPGEGPLDLVAAWRRAIEAGIRLAALQVAGHFWQDLGHRESYLAAHLRLLAGESPALGRLLGPLSDPLLAPDVRLAPGVRFGPGVVLGHRVRVEEGVFLERTVVLDDARLAAGVCLSGCVVGPGVRVTASAREAIIAGRG
ncbi:MAG: NTP transferase domain-containing protein [Syntrophobacterales bacterium]|nr:NTP transferase domain-containing protein [Syntrophobacterales bacterium]